MARQKNCHDRGQARHLRHTKKGKKILEQGKKRRRLASPTTVKDFIEAKNESRSLRRNLLKKKKKREF